MSKYLALTVRHDQFYQPINVIANKGSLYGRINDPLYKYQRLATNNR